MCYHATVHVIPRGYLMCQVSLTLPRAAHRDWYEDCPEGKAGTGRLWHRIMSLLLIGKPGTPHPPPIPKHCEKMQGPIEHVRNTPATLKQTLSQLRKRGLWQKLLWSAQPLYGRKGARWNNPTLGPVLRHCSDFLKESATNRGPAGSGVQLPAAVNAGLPTN